MQASNLDQVWTVAKTSGMFDPGVVCCGPVFEASIAMETCDMVANVAVEEPGVGKLPRGLGQRAGPVLES